MSDTQDEGTARKVAIGSDHAGFRLKQALAEVLSGYGLDVEDVGVYDESSCDYPDFAHAVARSVAEKEAELGILICGTGQGVSMAANRHQGVRAARCTDSYSAKMARLHNDANVLCLGSWMVGEGLAKDIVESFLTHSFEGGRHRKRVDKIDL